LYETVEGLDPRVKEDCCLVFCKCYNVAPLRGVVAFTYNSVRSMLLTAASVSDVFTSEMTFEDHMDLALTMIDNLEAERDENLSKVFWEFWDHQMDIIADKLDRSGSDVSTITII